ncbi:acyltransferase family protein [Schaalia sp. ZJ405]|uniref:acyltransferase family protein n=1 Tax=Schaalia sp. ZJ405 TaxID=2709403 RepID=UPI0013EB89CE|nr:acyltransferase family protein [Schaalia sp. ZJ405]QPK81192.1 acyltransferase family protein [Schaalia sp. ZJ405]
MMSQNLSPSTPSSASRPRNRAIDGVKALAIIAVVLYHTRPPMLEGGFLGVTVFLVVAGFFTTRSILRAQATGQWSYPRFIWARIRRVFPATVVTIAITAVLTYTFSPSLFPKVQRDALASVLFSTNWSYIFRNVSYFDNAGLPSPLTHLWYLAILMQFYVLLPLVLMAITRLTDRKQRLPILGAMAIVSTLTMALLFQPMSDVSRIYYGTDTRAAEFLIGVIAGIAANDIRPAFVSPRTKRATLFARVVALASLAVLIFGFVSARGDQPVLFRSGFACVAIATAFLLLSLRSPNFILGRLLSSRPLAAVGRRSLSIYLLHYPLLTLMNPATRTTDVTWWQWILQFLVIACVSEGFYRLIENPRPTSKVPASAKASATSSSSPGIMNEDESRFSAPTHLGPWRTLQSLRSRIRQWNLPRWAPPLRWLTVTLSVMGTLALIVAPVNWQGIAQTRAETLRPELTQSAQSARGHAVQSGRPTPPVEVAQSDTVAPEEPKVTPIAEKVPTNLPTQDWTYDSTTGVSDANPLIIGDSVTLGAQPTINAYLPNAYVDGKVSRQFWDGAQVFAEDVAQGHAGKVTIIALGANGQIPDESYIQTYIDQAAGQPIYFITTRTPLSFQDLNNALLRQTAARFSNVGIIDWHGASEGHPEYIVDDGTHLTAQGMDVFARLIRQALVGE